MDSTYGAGSASDLRYYLAKKKLDTLFVKWLRTNKQKVEHLLARAQTGKLKASEEANPLFSHHRVPHQNPSGVLNMSGINVPKGPLDQTNKKIQNNQSQLSQSLTKSTYFAKSFKPEVTNEKIPQFYFPQGKVVDAAAEAATRNTINTIFGGRNDADTEVCKKLVTQVIGLPNYFSICLFTKSVNPKKMTKVEFNRFWKEIQSFNIHKRAFHLLSSDKNKRYITVDDFKKFFKQILDVHPGLAFLKQSPEFQDWYALCVINRIFFVANKKNDYQLSFRQFKKSRILQSLFDIENEPEINENRDFFSYQDFYVIYIKFWELDSDHDFLLSKEQLSKYSGYTLSRKTIERVFSQVARKFQHPEKMTFGDFAWFIYCVQDKTTEQSIEYWFKILDLDNNGVVAGYELEFFYEEQSQRLAYMDGNSTDFNFENIVCQMMDLLKPRNSTQFLLQDFLKKKNQCGLFINFLTDLNKLVAFDQRDAYEEKNQKTEHPEWTEWDRFVKPEYKRVENAGEYEEGEEMLNWEDDA